MISNMTLDEILKEKKWAEEKIKLAIEQFEETGLRVQGFNCIWTEDIYGNKILGFAGLDIPLKDYDIPIY